MSKETKSNVFEDREFLVAINNATVPVINKYIGEVAPMGTAIELPEMTQIRGLLVIAVDAIETKEGYHMKHYVTCSGDFDAIISSIERLLSTDPVLSDVIMQAVTNHVIKQGPPLGGPIVN